MAQRPLPGARLDAVPADQLKLHRVRGRGDALNDNPLCDPMNKTTQLRAKAYPGLRELAALRSVGAQGITASICPGELIDEAAADYGYRPAIDALLAQVRQAHRRVRWCTAGCTCSITRWA